MVAKNTSDIFSVQRAILEIKFCKYLNYLKDGGEYEKMVSRVFAVFFSRVV